MRCRKDVNLRHRPGPGVLRPADRREDHGGVGKGRLPVRQPADRGRQERRVPETNGYRRSAMSYQLSRRAILRGLGTAMALPMLDAMAPGVVRAAATAAGGAAAAKPPRRMAFLYVPNG